MKPCSGCYTVEKVQGQEIKVFSEAKEFLIWGLSKGSREDNFLGGGIMIGNIEDYVEDERIPGEEARFLSRLDVEWDSTWVLQSLGMVTGAGWTRRP